jgi:hypothetical protein
VGGQPLGRVDEGDVRVGGFDLGVGVEVSRSGVREAAGSLADADDAEGRRRGADRPDPADERERVGLHRGGRDVVTVQPALGHASATTTLSTYSGCCVPGGHAAAGSSTAPAGARGHQRWGGERCCLAARFRCDAPARGTALGAAAGCGVSVDFSGRTSAMRRGICRLGRGLRSPDAGGRTTGARWPARPRLDPFRSIQPACDADSAEVFPEAADGPADTRRSTPMRPQPVGLPVSAHPPCRKDCGRSRRGRPG